MAKKRRLKATTSDSPETQFRFQAAEIARRDGLFIPNYADGEHAIQRDRELMVRLSRDFFQNNAIYRAIILGIVGVVVGEDGIEFNPILKSKKLKAELQKKWLTWTNEADISSKTSFTELERSILQELLVVGEVLIVKHSDYKLQLIESERIDKVNLKENGAYDSFEIAEPFHTERTTINASKCIYLSLTDRPSQVRGSGILWACADLVNMLSYILKKSARAWGMAANYAVAIESENAPEWAENATTSELTDAQVEAGIESHSYTMEDCQVFVGQKGEKISAISHNGIPNVQLGEHALTYLRIISSVIGVDASTFVLSDFSKTNYSSSRAANISLGRFVSRFQNKLLYTFYKPLTSWLVQEWYPTQDLLSCLNFICPKPKVIDAKGEAEAAEKELSLGLTTHNDLLLARNKSPEEFKIQRTQEIISAIQQANEIESQTGVKVHWETLCGMPLGKTESATQSNQNNGEQQ